MEMNPSPTRRWARAVREAVSATEPGEGVRVLLADAVAAAGAEGGAVLERAGEARWVVGWEAEALAAALEGDPRERLERVEEWIDDVLLLEVGAPEGGGPEHLLLAPLRVRELCTGALALRYAGARPPAPAQAAAAAFASVIALLLENDRLHEEARGALEAREHFLTALNHELRTPANALMLNADLMRSGSFGELPERLATALEEAESNVRLMIGVLRRVLDLGRLGDRASPAAEEVLQPREAITGLLRRMEPAAKRKKLALALYVPRTLPAIQTDPERFERILLHLLSNAVKYTAEGGVDVRIERGRRHLGPHRQEPVLIIRVVDTGCGIPAAELERVFEPFAQVEEGARSDTRRRGTGLGLPLARQLARSLRGEVTIESTVGRGTTATFVLPYHSP